MVLIVVGTTNQHVQAQNSYNRVELQIENVDDMPLLQWSNKREINAGYYILEYSYDSCNFTALTMRKALGSSIFQTNYSYTHVFDKKECIIYYRVVLVLMGGERILSAVKTYGEVETVGSIEIIAAY